MAFAQGSRRLLLRAVGMLAGIAVLVSLLAGCGGSQPSSSNSGSGSKPGGAQGLPPVTKDPVKLSFSFWVTSETATKGFQILADEFHNKYPNITVDLQQIPHKDYYTQLDTRVAGGNAPDIARVAYGQEKRYAEAGKLVDLTPYLPPGLKDAYDQRFWGIGTYKGQQIMVPHITDTVVLYYNKDAFKKAGLTPPTAQDPWTWEQFAEAGKKLQAAGYKYGYTSALRHPKTYVSYLFEQGVEFMDASGTKSAFNTPAAVKAIQNSIDSVQGAAEPSSAIWARVDSPDQLFAQGVAPMGVIGIWLLDWMTQNAKGFEWGVAPGLKGASVGTDIGGSGFMIPKGGKHEREAAEFLNFLTAEENMAKYAAYAGYIPTRTALEGAGKVQYRVRPADVDVAVKYLNANINPKHLDLVLNPKYAAIEKAVNDEVEQAVLGKKPAADAAAAIAKKIDQALKPK